MQKNDDYLLNSLDIRTLRMLSYLLESCSITRTGETFGLSQPAASRIVARLRDVIADPLLVRTRRGYVCTPRAVQLKDQLAIALRDLEQALKPDVFEPASTRRVFRIATTDYGAMSVLTPMMPKLVQQSPLARVDVVPWSANTLEQLAKGGLDVALYADADLPPDFHHKELFTETYAFLMRNGHEAAEHLPEKVGIADLQALSKNSQVFIMYPMDQQTYADDPFEWHGLTPKHVSMRTPYFMSTPWIVAETDLLMMVPLRAARRMANLAGLSLFELDDTVGSFSYRLIWHERVEKDAGILWLRDLIDSSV